MSTKAGCYVIADIACALKIIAMQSLAEDGAAISESAKKYVISVGSAFRIIKSLEAYGCLSEKVRRYYIISRQISKRFGFDV